MNKSYKYFELITALFVTVLLVSNIASSKILLLGPFTLDGGTILFPLSYIFGDILVEVYGYARSRKVIWTGFAMILLASIVFMIVGFLPESPDWGGQKAYETILGLTPRIVAASVIAFLAGEFSNAVILAKLKVRTNGKYLWLRTISSTIIGQLFDTLIFLIIAFAGVFTNDLLWSIFVSNYIFKVGVEILFTPITYGITTFLKAKEHEDFYDKNTDFNPFSLKESSSG